MNSFWRCDSCRYVYRIQKLQHLDVLKHPLFISAVSLLLILAAAFAGSLVYGNLLPFRDRLTSQAYRYIRFHPPWRKRERMWPSLLSSMLDSAFMSVFSIGLAGFAWIMYKRYRMHRGEEVSQSSPVSTQKPKTTGRGQKPKVEKF